MATGVVRQAQTSGGLTIATTAYTALDQVGTLFTFTNFANASGGTGYLESIELTDETSTTSGSFNVWCFRTTQTANTDNLAFTISDAAAEDLCFDPIPLGPIRSYVNGSVQGWNGRVPYDLTGTSMFVMLQLATTRTFFTAVTDIKLALTVNIQS